MACHNKTASVSINSLIYQDFLLHEHTMWLNIRYKALRKGHFLYRRTVKSQMSPWIQTVPPVSPMPACLSWEVWFIFYKETTVLLASMSMYLCAMPYWGTKYPRPIFVWHGSICFPVAVFTCYLLDIQAPVCPRTEIVNSVRILIRLFN